MTAGQFLGPGRQVVDSRIWSPTFEAVVALLREQYLTAFERCCARAAKLVDHTAHGPPPLDGECQALENRAALRAALLDALAALERQMTPSLGAETRDEIIQRSIAKRSQGGLGAVCRIRLYRPRRIA